MRTIDFSPIFRHTVGFDRMQRLMNSAMQQDNAANTYPPYNIEQTGENDYSVTLALAGFGEEDVEITTKENTLVVAGKLEREDDNDISYLYRGIAGRAFERRFELADHIKVTNASLANGLLKIELMREIPEEEKLKKISITANVIKHERAA